MDLEVQAALDTFVLPEILVLVTPHITLTRATKRNWRRLLEEISAASNGVKDIVKQVANSRIGSKRQCSKRKQDTDDARPSKRLRRSTEGENGRADEAHVVVDNPIQFLEAVDPEHEQFCLTRAINRTGNDALRKELCMICARRLFMDRLRAVAITDVPNKRHLIPTHPHPAHALHGLWLFHEEALAKNATYAYRKTINSGMKGNVSTYRLNTAEISDIIQGGVMPPAPTVLSATIGVTFVGTRNIPLKLLPDFLRVRRNRVADALHWLKQHNRLYSEIEISRSQLELLPINGVPDEISNNVNYSVDTLHLDREQNGYVPLDAADEEEAMQVELEAKRADAYEADRAAQQSGFNGIDSENMDVDGVDVTKPAAFPLQLLGIVDAGGDNIPDSDIMAHALANSGSSRFDGGPGDANHMLGAFPFLFPYGKGGIEVDREVKVPYEAHVRWALQYGDGRFRQDFYFIFQAFGVLQKRQVCRAACLQVTRSAFIHNQAAFLHAEETRRVRFSNPVVQSLRNNITAVRARAVRGQIWVMNLRFNPPSIWATINLLDTNDPIAQVLAGADIDLDNFVAAAGPDRAERAMPEFFHLTINVILQEIFGIHAIKGGRIRRRKGILGTVNGYISTVEAQGRGTLHLHILMWLRGAPNSIQMSELLRTEQFRTRNIRADIAGTSSDALCTAKKLSNPRKPSYEAARREMEFAVSRAVQMKKGQYVCKRHAPFPLASDDWILPNGDWGPRRLFGKINTWNPTVLQFTRANHDMKLVTHGEQTKDIGFYITLYIAKKQTQASNASALLAKSLAYHRKIDRHLTDCRDVNKRMLQQCAKTLSRQHEFSGAEVVSYLMGWGDCFVSHMFVVIYWDTISSALHRA
ncbi:hypothetical protein B0H17DRAFT_1159660 [Mycena rosella]|uniref:Helitron helicase-like domain-containing protein n=1 Tax=Mycena rosella TaxID=1033263 RepID=A0AAD7GJJ1_MYCRO|nr:hypothetical protein B0H17DRAFT_1159660 [Mycena rosella]